MPRYLLRVEAVNLLATVIDDTDDLSTRRGGGLLALNAVRQIATNAGTPGLRARLNEVATGASVGLFTFDAADAADAEGVRDEVAKFLRTEPLEYAGEDGKTKPLQLCHATFVVDVEPAAGPQLGETAQRVTARNRWRQMQQPSVSLAGLWDRKPGEKTPPVECRYNCVRPAVPECRLPKDSREPTAERLDVCRSVYERHQYGRLTRQKLYGDELGAEYSDLTFTDTLHALAGRAELSDGLAPEGTGDKLAVFYLDGNGFGGIGQQRWADGADGFRRWSEGVQQHHRERLKWVLDAARADESWRTPAGEVRLETLLWGGDEIIWVVPAWKGWELVALFFREDHAINGQPVAYSVGLVFCHLKAAVKDVVRLAHDLGEAAKAVGGGNRLAYEVMESYDDVFGDLTAHRRKWLPDDRPPDELALDPRKVAAALPHLRAVAACDDFPVRQLYRLYHEWRAGRPVDRHRDRLLKSEARADLEAAQAALGVPDELFWLHLLQMRPYLPTAEAGR